MNSNTVPLLGYDISTLSANKVVSDALSSSHVTTVNTINPHSYVESKTDKVFNQALKQSDVLIPDGSGITLAAKVLNGIELEKVAGFDLFVETMGQLNERNGKVFFLGSTNEILNEIKIKVKNDYPNVTVDVLSPPYKSEFSDCEQEGFIGRINSFAPDVLFVGLTAPKQEKLIHALKVKLDVKMVSGIGAVFDFYAGRVKRPGEIWINLHLEWLVRFLGEPKRLWRRNFISTPIFLKDICVNKIKGIKN